MPKIDRIVLPRIEFHRRLGGRARLRDQPDRQQRLGSMDRQRARVPASRPVAVGRLVVGGERGRKVAPDNGRLAPVLVHHRGAPVVTGEFVQFLRALEIVLCAPPVPQPHPHRAAVVANRRLQQLIATAAAQRVQRLPVARRRLVEPARLGQHQRALHA